MCSFSVCMCVWVRACVRACVRARVYVGRIAKISPYIPTFCLTQIHKSTISVFVDGRLLNPSIHDAIMVAPATASQYRVGQSLDGNVDVFRYSSL